MQMLGWKWKRVGGDALWFKLLALLTLLSSTCGGRTAAAGRGLLVRDTSVWLHRADRAGVGRVERLRGGGVFGKKIGGKYGGMAPRSASLPNTNPPPAAADSPHEPAMIRTHSAPVQVEVSAAGAGGGGGMEPGQGMEAEIHTFRHTETEDGGGKNDLGGIKHYAAVQRVDSSSDNWFKSATLPATKPIKYLYIVSDSTGFTASHAITSVLAQFDGLSVDREETAGVVNATELLTQMFPNVQEWHKFERIIQLAARMHAMIAWTVVDKEMCEMATKTCRQLGVPFHDVIRPVLMELADFFGVSPTCAPRTVGHMRKPLSTQYFKRIEAVEFTIKQDDGALTRNLCNADVVLLGVSRSSKTPLSMYLAQQYGYKVANVPLVQGIPPPPEIFDCDPRTVFGLTIQPAYLKRIRTTRLKGTGVDEATIGVNQGSHDYTSMKYITQELKMARDLYNANPQWTVLDVTGRAVEENAAIIAELMPGKPTPVEAALHALDCTFFIIDPNPLQHKMQYDKTHKPAFEGSSHETPLSEDTAIMFASDGFLQAVGYTAEEIIGRSPWMLHGPLTNNETIANVQQHIKEGKEGHFKILNYRKDGTTFTKELHLSPVQDVDGNTAFVFATQCTLNPLAYGFHPITKTKSEQDAVEEGEFKREKMEIDKRNQILRNVQNRGYISVCIYDGTIPDLPLVFASDGFFKMCMYGPQEILGHNLLMLRGKDTDPRTVEKIKTAIRNREDVSTCILNYRKDGTPFWNYISLQPVLDMNKELRYYVGTQYAGTQTGITPVIRKSVDASY